MGEGALRDEPKQRLQRRLAVPMRVVFRGVRGVRTEEELIDASAMGVWYALRRTFYF